MTFLLVSSSCIVKSMKTGSTCPVCKVPFRRRGMWQWICLYKVMLTLRELVGFVAAYRHIYHLVLLDERVKIWQP
jgi:hypothetical protein